MAAAKPEVVWMSWCMLRFCFPSSLYYVHILVTILSDK